MPTTTTDELVNVLHQRVQAARNEHYNASPDGKAFESPKAERDWAVGLLRGWIDGENQDRLNAGIDALTPDDERAVATTVLDRVFGLGMIDRLLRDPNVSDIHVMGHDHCMIRLRNGEWRSAGAIARSDDELLRLIQTAAARHGGNIERRFDSLHPELNMQLKDGSRLFALRDVCDRPQMVIRKHDHNLASLADLVDTGMITPAAAHLLESAVRARLNIVLIGATSSGKTTMLRALCAEMPPHEFKVTIEEAKEIGLERDKARHPLVRALETRPADLQGNGAIEAQQLVRMSLRMDPDRVILGEVRGGEALQMLTAMTQGQRGSLCTMHGDSAAIAYARLMLYVKFGGVAISDEDVAKLIADAIHLVVFVKKQEAVVGSGRYTRVVAEIAETRDAHGTRMVSNMIMRRDADGNLITETKPSDAIMDDLLQAGFQYDWWMEQSRPGATPTAVPGAFAVDQPA